MADNQREESHRTRNQRTTIGGAAMRRGPSQSAGPSLTTTLLVGAGVALLQPELLPGMVIGVAATMAPKLLPLLGSALQPLIKTAVQVGYATVVKAREMASEASDQMQDIFAEAHVEQKAAAPANPSARAARRRPRAA